MSTYKPKKDRVTRYTNGTWYDVKIKTAKGKLLQVKHRETVQAETGDYFKKINYEIVNTYWFNL